MTTIRKQAIDLIMNLSDSEIQQILEKYELIQPDSTAIIEPSVNLDEPVFVSAYNRDSDVEFLEALEE